MPGAPITLRRGSAADAAPAADLWLRARAAAAATGAIPPPAHDDADVRAWFAGHVIPHTALWLAEVGGTLAGLLVLDGDGVDQLYVDPALTGRGIGSALLARAKEQSPAGLQLWTFAANAGALRFYARHGFAEIRRTDGRANEERAPDVLLKWAPQTTGARRAAFD